VSFVISPVDWQIFGKIIYSSHDSRSPFPQPAVDPSAGKHPNNKTRSRYGHHNKKQEASLFDIVEWFITMTTNEYIRNVKTSGWETFPGQLWQQGYWEHIIRNSRDYSKPQRGAIPHRRAPPCGYLIPLFQP